MKKTDWLIIVAALFAAGAFFTFNALTSRGSVQSVRISVDGKVYQTVALGKPQTIPINIDGKINIIEITEHGARMADANCVDKLCVHQGEITKSNQTIVCLPHKVVIELIGDSDGELDTISQ